MISLTQFRMNVFSLFKVLSSSNMILEVVHDRKVYDVTITLTDKKPTLTRPKRKLAPQIRQIDAEVCDECGSMKFNGVCMNRQCIHSTGSLSEATAQIQSKQ